MRTCNGRKAVSFKDAKMGNELPLNVKLLPSLAILKVEELELFSLPLLIFANCYV